MSMFDLWGIISDDEALSDWALNYCRYGKNDPKIRKYITTSIDAYLYCKNIKDDPKIRKLINQPSDAFLYRTWVRDDIKWMRDLSS